MSAAQPRAAEGWTAVVLAAGRGTRMRSRRPKVLHHVAGRAMLDLVCDALAAAGFERQVVVAAAPDDEVARAAEGRASIAVQHGPLGTGHAALAARAAAADAQRVLIVHADLPLLTAETFAALARAQREQGADLAFLTVELDDPTGYGRVLRANGRGAGYGAQHGAVAGIVEETETDADTRRIREVNTGVYAADAAWLWEALERLGPGPRGEVYLPDVIRAGLEAGRSVHAHRIEDPAEAQQVNTRAELARADRALRDRVRAELMAGGVTLVDPAATYVDAGVEVGEDTTLLPGTHLLGATAVGRECEIGPHAVLRDMLVGDGCTIGGSTLEGSTLADGVRVGPYCHVRPGSTIEADVHLGNYVEVKASRVGARSRVGHFSYLGDADIGSEVNIGAGTITANYDGVDKHRTEIGDGAFIGSDSMLVAPLRVGAGARTAAGSVVTRDVPDGALAIGAPARVRGGGEAEDGGPEATRREGP